MRLKDMAVEFTISKDTQGTTIMCGQNIHCGVSRVACICKDDEEMLVIARNAKAKTVKLDACKLWYWLADWDCPPKEKRLLKTFDVSKLETLGEMLSNVVARAQRGESLADVHVETAKAVIQETKPVLVEPAQETKAVVITPEPTPAVIVVEAPVLDVVLETPAPAAEQAPEVKEGIIESRFSKRDKKKNRHQQDQTDDTVTE